jgi:hypothetical protein
LADVLADVLVVVAAVGFVEAGVGDAAAAVADALGVNVAVVLKGAGAAGAFVADFGVLLEAAAGGDAVPEGLAVVVVVVVAAADAGFLLKKEKSDPCFMAEGFVFLLLVIVWSISQQRSDALLLAVNRGIRGMFRSNAVAALNNKNVSEKCAPRLHTHGSDIANTFFGAPTSSGFRGPIKASMKQNDPAATQFLVHGCRPHNNQPSLRSYCFQSCVASRNTRAPHPPSPAGASLRSERRSNDGL